MTFLSNRISREQMWMEMAHTVAKRSTCMRLSVGCVLVSQRNVLSIGYNGPPAGELHCTGQTCCPPGQGCMRSIHAEINAFQKINPMRNLTPIEVYVTDSPCPDCFDLITRPWWGVKSIYFSTLYRINDHLRHPNINIYCMTKSGYITNYQTGELVC